jgi:hypothetical protein
MRRLLLPALLIGALILSACAGGSTDVPPPPASEAYAPDNETEVGRLITTWQTVAWAEMEKDLVKPETKVEAIYRSTASLEDIAAFYDSLVETSGWWRLKRMPGLQGDFLLAGYEHGTTALVVGAVDASQLGGDGVVIYTLKGTK